MLTLPLLVQSGLLAMLFIGIAIGWTSRGYSVRSRTLERRMVAQLGLPHPGRDQAGRFVKRAATGFDADAPVGAGTL